jgi:hypothetical protein
MWGVSKGVATRSGFVNCLDGSQMYRCLEVDTGIVTQAECNPALYSHWQGATELRSD